MSLAEASAEYLPWIEAELRAVVSSADPTLAGHYGIMQYHMGWLDEELRPAAAPTGKRLRPLLCLLACAAAGGDPRQAVPAAAGLELLHNFSLIHDDIEDHSLTRRHRPTAWKLFGLALACNAGDGMFGLAHLAFHRLAQQGVPAPIVLAALRILDQTCVALTEGQYLDLYFESRPSVTAEEYFAMIAGKTAALLAAAPQIGALIAGAPAAAVEAYRQYGAALGRAFQLQDDILGIWGDEAVTGKSAASDILSRKKSLPVVYTLSHPTAGPALARLYADPLLGEADVPRVLALLEEAGARGYVEGLVQSALHEARQALELVRPAAVAPAYAALRELLDTLAGRVQ
jgi:geranylgeranyl diphosphate synthase type I